MSSAISRPFSLAAASKWREASKVPKSVGVGGRAREGDVQCDIEAFLFGGSQQVAEVVESAELGSDRLVPAFRRAYGPWAAWLVRRSLDAVVGPLAVGAPDRVDGRQVKDVETHARDVGQALFDVAERAVATGLPGRSREQLIPGAEPSALGIHEQRELARVIDGLAS